MKLLIVDMVMIGIAALMQLRNIAKYDKTNGALKTRITFMVLWVCMFVHCYMVYIGKVTGVFFTIGILAVVSLYFRTHHQE